MTLGNIGFSQTLAKQTNAKPNMLSDIMKLSSKK